MLVGKRFENLRILVSGGDFEACVFTDCELVHDGRPARLVDNTFVGCRWSFEGAAGDTLEFAATLCRQSAEFGMSMARTLGIAREEGGRTAERAGSA